MNQPDLFAADTPPEIPVYRPDPAKVRSRLEKIMGEARRADWAPWDPARLSLYRTIVPDMTRWLPDDEAARWRGEFEALLARLATP
jgi:hypothetical protein